MSKNWLNCKVIDHFISVVLQIVIVYGSDAVTFHLATWSLVQLCLSKTMRIVKVDVNA